LWRRLTGGPLPGDVVAPAYVIGDETAVKVADGAVEVVSEGE
jgi:hypothetical protein